MKKRKYRSRYRRNRNRKIMIGAACAIVVLAGAGIGVGYYFKVAQNQPAINENVPIGIDITEVPTEEITEPTELETTTEIITEPVTEKETEPETGAIRSGTLPPSTDYFIISENADAFFENSVFIGDSVMMGFRNYIMGQPQGFLGGPEFLVSGSFSVRMALNTISKDTIHPIYQGEQHYIWDSIKMMGAKKVFLFFGLNDIDMEGVDGTCENYLTVIEKIKEVNPTVEIYVISTTYMLSGSEKGDLNNDNIRLLNAKMKEQCDAGVAEYIDITSFLVGEDGGLKPELCSDAYVHQTYASYEIWTKVLRNYASGGFYKLKLEPETESLDTEGQTGEDTSETASEASDSETETKPIEKEA